MLYQPNYDIIMVAVYLSILFITFSPKQLHIPFTENFENYSTYLNILKTERSAYLMVIKQLLAEI